MSTFFFVGIEDIQSQITCGYCRICPELIRNGDFESFTSDCPTAFGVEYWSGVSNGCMNEWECRHGTPDFFISNGNNWYGSPSPYPSTVVHLGFGRLSDYSEGVIQDVDICGDDDLTYCCYFDVAMACQERGCHRNGPSKQTIQH